MMAGIGFSDAVTTQLSLAELHGNLALSLEKISAYLENMRKVKKKLIEVSTYPLILLGFLVLIMLGLRNYLLPQMDAQNIGTQLISSFPQLFLALGVGLVTFFLLGFLYYRQSGKIKVFRTLSHLPFGKGMIQAYLTAYYAREWGNLIGQGLELSQIFSMMQDQKSQLFQEIGRDLALSLDRGQSFSETVRGYPFFKKELPLMIEYGEVKSKLGSELEIYAEKTWEDFFRRVHKAMNVIQPLVFIFVALVIVKKLKTYKVKAFTLIEMLVVLLIISVLLLLFVPNLTKQKDSVKETGNAAVVKVVESQAELYELNHTNDQATLAKLIADGNITNKQAESYRAYYAKNSGETRAVAD